MDERGYCRIVGRLKDMIIRGGENLFPAEIEEVLYRHPSIAEVAVIGLPDEKWGEVVAAFVRPVDPASAPTVAELRAHLRDHISPQKTPTLWFVGDAYPLTGSGKIQKFAIREAWEKGLYENACADRATRRRSSRRSSAVPPMADLSELVHVDEERVGALLMFLLGSVLWQVPDREEGAARCAPTDALCRRTRAQGCRPVPRRSGR
jgi:hypothetical protein